MRDEDKERILEAVRELSKVGFKVIATSGTQRFLSDSGVPTEKIKKMKGKKQNKEKRKKEKNEKNENQH